MHRNQEHSTLAEAISSGRLPCLRVLDLDLLHVHGKLDTSVFSPLVAGQVPSLRDLRLRVFSIEDGALPTMLRLMALPHLECLHLNCSFRVLIPGYDNGAENIIRNAAKKYPHLTVQYTSAKEKRRRGTT